MRANITTVGFHRGRPCIISPDNFKTGIDQTAGHPASSTEQFNCPHETPAMPYHVLVHDVFHMPGVTKMRRVSGSFNARFRGARSDGSVPMSGQAAP